MSKTPYEQGYDGYRDAVGGNPYSTGSREYDEWRDGWHDAEVEDADADDEW